MTLSELNALPEERAREEFERCCGARRWAADMAARRPFASRDGLFQAARESFAALAPGDWLEAFRHHPKIGDLESLKKKFAATATWAAGEQAGAAEAPASVISALADGNTRYESKFGWIFIVCATGKTAPAMLELLQERLGNDSEAELRVAAGEQAKITTLRLEKLLS